MKKKTKNRFLRHLRDFGVYLLVLLALGLVRFLPFRVMRALGRFGGNVAWGVAWPIRKLVLSNLNIAFPEKSERERRRIGRMSLQSLCTTALEMFWFSGSVSRVKKYASVPSPVIETFSAACTKNGCVVVVPHFGNWEVSGIAFDVTSSMSLGVVARPFDNPYINALVNRARCKLGNEVIPSVGAGKGMIRHLKRGLGVATLIDQNTTLHDGGIFVDFFGLPATASRAPAMFALKLGSGLALSACRRVPGGFDYHIIPLKEIPQTEKALTQALTKITEDFVRQYPEQYLWYYRRYRYIDVTAPAEVQARYPFYARIPQRYFYEKRELPSAPVV